MSNGEAPEKKSNALLWVLLGCGGALVLAAILAIVAAVAIPALVRVRSTAKSVSTEANAVGSCRAYAEAQVMFHRNDWVGSGTPGVLEYATPYTLLNTQPDNVGQPIQLIDAALAAAQGPNGTPKHGYLFRDMKTIGGVKINWVDDFAICAIPAQYGRTGYRTFIISTNGTVFGKDQGPTGTFVDDYPQNPTVAGWIIAE
jgi:type II secretory pathway pseudopilin PulG